MDRCGPVDPPGIGHRAILPTVTQRGCILLVRVTFTKQGADDGRGSAAGCRRQSTEDIFKALDVPSLLWDDEYMIGDDDVTAGGHRGAAWPGILTAKQPRRTGRCRATISGRGDERLRLQPQGFRLAGGGARQRHWRTKDGQPADACAAPTRSRPTAPISPRRSGLRRLQYRWRQCPPGGGMTIRPDWRTAPRPAAAGERTAALGALTTAPASARPHTGRFSPAGTWLT